jgi:hypothetical protein
MLILLPILIPLLLLLREIKIICHGWWLTIERSAQGQHMPGLVHVLPVERFIKFFGFLEQSLFRK